MKKNEKIKMKKNQILRKIIKIVLVLSLISYFLFLFSFAYYSNINKFFLEQQNSYVDGEGQHRLAEDFIIDGCGTGTILDIVTGLCWLKNMNTFELQNWTNAFVDCSSLDYVGHTNWKLPSRAELLSLIDEIGPSGTTCITLESFGFINCKDHYYWSSNSMATNNDRRFTIYFYNNGYCSNRDKSYDGYHVTCVRRN